MYGDDAGINSCMYEGGGGWAALCAARVCKGLVCMCACVCKRWRTSVIHRTDTECIENAVQRYIVARV